MVFSCFHVFFSVSLIASVLGFILGQMLDTRAGVNTNATKKKTPRTKLEKVEALVLSLWVSPLGIVTRGLNVPEDLEAVIKAFAYWALAKVFLVLYFTNADPISSDISCRLVENSEGCTTVHEYLSTLDAVYMASVSMATVGYGDLSPSGEEARGLAVVWLLFCSLITAEAFGMTAEMFFEHRQARLNKKNLHKEYTARSIMKLDDDKSGEVSEIEFVAHMLVQTQIVDLGTLTDIRERFKELDVTGDGFITEEDLVEVAEVELEEEQHSSAPAASCAAGDSPKEGGVAVRR